MTTTTSHPVAERYLRELERALADVPRARREEIIEEIRGHIAEATAEGRSDEAAVRNVLDELGEPEAIAADARERFGVSRKKAGAMEGFAIALLLIGGLVIPVVGWFIGAILLWISASWSTKEKVIGTLLLPGGLALPFFFATFASGASSSCSIRIGDSGNTTKGVCDSQTMGPEVWSTVLLVAMVVIPIATAIYLGRRAFRH